MEKFNEDDGVWRTISGRRVFIRDGESVESAMSRSGKFNKMSRVQKNKDKYDKIEQFKKRKATNKLDEEPTPRKKEKIHLVKDKDNRYIVSRGEDDNEAVENYKRKYGSEEERNEEPSRREKLMRYTQENKDKIAQYGREYDEETNKQAFEKAKRGEGLSSKEYFGMIGSQERPGDIISDVTADGEDVIVAKDGQWVRKSRIDDYNRNPSANKDAIVDYEEEERKIDEREKINRFREQKQSNYNPYGEQRIESIKNAINEGTLTQEQENNAIKAFRKITGKHIWEYFNVKNGKYTTKK